MKKEKFKILFLFFVFIFLISSNIDISNNYLTDYINNDKEDEYYSNRIHLTQSPINSSSNWWNSLYNYRNPINITNINTKKLPKGYSVNISINTAKLISDGKLRSDGNDLRIVWYNSSNKAWVELDRVNESNFNTFDTRIWFKIQEIIYPGTSDTSYYFYYGNPNAFIPPMNKSKIYGFYDDFTQPDGVADGWTSLSGTWEVSDKEYQESSNLLDCTSLLNTFTITNSSIEVRVKTNGTSFGVGVKFRYENPTNFFCAGLGYWDREISFGKQNASGWTEIAFDGADESNLVNNQWYNLKIESIGNRHKIYLDNILRIDTTHNDHLNNDEIGLLTWTTNTSFYDDLKIRLLMSPEPTLTLGNEELYRHSSEDFLYYKTFIIDNSKVFGPTKLNDYPLLISIKDPDLRHHCQPDGDDIAFSNGTIWLDHEIELFDQTFNTTHAKLIAWVRIPSLSPITDTNITMYYGNPSINSQENPLKVWDDNFKGVWHLSEDPTGTVYDSTLNNNDGTSYGSMNSADQVSGKIDGSLEFDGDDDYIDCGNDDSLDITGDITIEFWVNGVSFSNDLDPDILTKGSYTQAYSTWINDDGAVYFQLNGNSLYSTYKIPLGDWYHVVCVRSGSNRIIYVNGTLDISDSFSPAIEIITESLTIARSPDNLNGTLDEIRLSNVARSADWIATEYNNQYEPDSFYSAGRENLVHTYLPHDNYFAHYKIITINHTKVSGDGVLLDFPLLFSIIDSDLYDAVQTDGDDIAFAKDNVWLAHEIEVFNYSYSPTESQLISWVKVPFLSGANETQFYMYYGNSTMNSQENPTGVWDSNYLGVLHLNDLNSSTVKDSTVYKNHGIKGAINQPSEIDAKIGKGQVFTPLNEYIQYGSTGFTNTSGTLEIWGKAYTFSSTDTQYFIGHTTEPTWNNRIQIYVDDSNGNLDLGLGNNHSLATNIQDLDNNTWYHIVLTWEDYTYSLYVDGVSKASGTYTNLNTFDSFVDIGNDGSVTHRDESWDGILDEFRFSDIPRSSDWIATGYNNQYDPDSFYSIGSENQMEDMYPPDIIINSPNHYELFGLSAPSYDLTVIDANLDSIWYSLNGGANSTPVSTSGALDQTMWDSEGNGTVIIRFYANDSAGNLNSEEITVKKDILEPTITINDPSENDLFGINAPSYDISVSDRNLDSIWYSLNKGISNSTPVPVTGTIDQTMWSLRPNGTVTIRFYANDTAGNINYSDIIVYKDIIEPSISINSPSSSDLFGLSAPDYNLSVLDGNLDSIWYTLDSGTTNSTPVSAIGTIDQAIWSLRPNGTVTIRFYANDTLGNLNFADAKVLKDILTPIMSIIEPNNYTLFGDVPPYINLSIIDGNLDQVWYQLDNGTVITNNYTWAGFIAQSVWDQMGNGTVIIRFYANDTVGNLANAEVIVYKDIYLPIITIINPILNEVFNDTAPSFMVSISGSNLDSTWYTLNNGVVNYTFTGMTGSIDQSAWTSRADGTVTINFYINNTLGMLGFDEVNVIKDTFAPQITLNRPFNNTYCGTAPIINVLVTDANLNSIWYKVNTSYVLLANNINQQLETSIWTSLFEGEFYIYICANDSASNLSDPLILRLYKDTSAPSAPNLISFPQGVVNGNLLFEWEEGSDLSGILKYRLIIDNEANPFATPGFVFETNLTESSYTFIGTLQPGTYHFFLYQIDGVGHQSSASTGTFSISSNTGPSEFPIWIIFIIIGVAIGGLVGIIVLKKSKGKKQLITQIPEKKPVAKTVQEVPEEISQLDYDILTVMNHNELIGREEKLLEHIRQLEENKKYGKAAEFLSELILIEDILGNSQEVKLYRQKQIDIAIKGLEYLKDQYEIESKKAAISGDYSKALELYNESKVISDNLKGYMEHQETSDPEENITLETTEPQSLTGEVEIVYSCMNDLLTKYFDDIGIKYYSNPQIYKNIQAQIHGLILADQFQLEDIDPLVRERIKSIQFIFTDDMSNGTITNLCKTFHNPYVLLTIVGIKWPKNIEAQIIEIPPNIGEQYHENIRIIHYELFITLMGLTGAYEAAFKEIIDLYDKSEIEILRETQESSEVIIHSSDELRYDLKEKGLITDKLGEYFNR